MGKALKTITDKIILLIPDRNPNRIYIYTNEKNEVAIHFRNMKIVLLTPEEIEDWKRGFKRALEVFKKGNYLQNDI